MKKTLLAAALAVGFAGVAQAETSVTLYGIIDTGVAYERIKTGSGKHNTATKFGIYDGTTTGQAGSRWGLRGTEDLGNGLRAVFQLESGFDITTGNSYQGGRLFGRQATLGLHSDSWGQVDFGRQTTVGSKYFLGMVDPFAGGFGNANAGNTFTSVNTVRWDNTIIYQTPNFSGFQAGIGYSFNTGGTQMAKIKGEKDTNNRGITAAVRYSNGPIGLVATYDQISNSAAKDLDRSSYRTIREWNIGGAYDFEVVKVSLGFGQTRGGQVGAPAQSAAGLLDLIQAWDAGNIANAADARAVLNDTNLGYSSRRDGRINKYLVGLSAPVGGGTVLASWHMADANKKWAGSDRKKQQTYSLGYKYPLSKRTDVYAYGSHTKNLDFTRKHKSDTLAVGITHRF